MYENIQVRQMREDNQEPSKDCYPGTSDGSCLMMAQQAELCDKCYESIYDIMDDFFTHKEKQ